jgi:hypothetical protein
MMLGQRDAAAVVGDGGESLIVMEIGEERRVKPANLL